MEILVGAGIAPLREDRGGGPLLLCGGPATFLNPEPIADFIDAAVLGDGEQAALEITALIRDFKADGSPGGRELVPPTELLLTRDMSYSEAFALAKAQEEAELLTAMQDDIVQQVLRRLAQANPAAPASPPRP